MDDNLEMVDHRVLADLRNSLGAAGNEAFQRVLGAYLIHTPRLLDALKVALVGPLWEELSRAAHTLRSSSAALGAGRLAHAAKVLEEAADRRDTAVGAHVAEVEELVDAVMAALRSELGKRATPQDRP